MLSVNFKLTTAQTRLLLNLTYWNYTQLAPDLLTIQPRREGVPDLFITTIRCLIDRRLAEHRPFEFPPYIATDEGRALAGLILAECRDVVTMADGMSKRMKAIAPAIRLCKEHAACCRKIAMNAAKKGPTP